MLFMAHTLKRTRCLGTRAFTLEVVAGVLVLLYMTERIHWSNRTPLTKKVSLLALAVTSRRIVMVKDYK